MSVSRRVLYYSGMREDIPMLRSIESSVSGDFDSALRGVITGLGNAYLCRGFDIVIPTQSGTQAAALQVQVSDSAVLVASASESGTILTVPVGTPNDVLNPSLNSNVIGSFQPGGVNFVALDYRRDVDETSVDQTAGWVPSQNIEVQRTVPVASLLEYRYIISTNGFGQFLPLWIVNVNADGTVAYITKAVPGLFRLGSGGLDPNPFNTFNYGGLTNSQTFYTFTLDGSQAFAIYEGDVYQDNITLNLFTVAYDLPANATTLVCTGTSAPGPNGTMAAYHTSFPAGTITYTAVTSAANTIQEWASSTFGAPNPMTVVPGNDPNAFQYGDWSIKTMKNWMDAVMTRFVDLTGSPFWYTSNGTFSSSSRTLTLSANNTNMLTVYNGGLGNTYLSAANVSLNGNPMLWIKGAVNLYSTSYLGGGITIEAGDNTTGTGSGFATAGNTYIYGGTTAARYCNGGNLYLAGGTTADNYSNGLQAGNTYIQAGQNSTLGGVYNGFISISGPATSIAIGNVLSTSAIYGYVYLSACAGVPTGVPIAAPAPNAGTVPIIYDSTDNRMYVYSSSWKTLGTVTSVGLSMPGIFTVSNSPVTTSGTLTVALNTQSANLIWASPVSGVAAAPTFRSLVSADIPAALTLGSDGVTAGSLHLASVTSGDVTIQVLGAVSTYNFNLPITVGTAGQVLTSQGGGATAMTWSSALINPMSALGDIIYENASPAPARLAGNITTTKTFLTQTGTGSVSAAPNWNTIALGDLPSITQAKLAARPISTNGTDPGAGGVVFSLSVGQWTLSSTITPSIVYTMTGGGSIVSVTLTTTGRPVFIGATGVKGVYGCTVSSYEAGSGVAYTTIDIIRSDIPSTPISSNEPGQSAGTGSYTLFPCSSVVCGIDTPAAGTYTYYLQATNNAIGTNFQIDGLKLFAYEL